MKIHYPAYFALLMLLSMSCHLQTVADLVIVDAFIYSPDGASEGAVAVAIKDGIIIRVGSNEAVNELVGSHTEVIHAQGKFLMPGFMEGHAHLIALGESLLRLNLISTTSWQGVLDSVSHRMASLEPGEVLIGRGWHQEKWTDADTSWPQGYPHHSELSALSPDNPVVLLHASNHSLLANHKAMQLLGISANTPDPDGGRIIRDEHGPTGIFDENAMKPFLQWMDSVTMAGGGEAYRKKCIQLATEHCHAMGITAFIDAMSTHDEIMLLKQMAENDELGLRVYAMLYNKDIAKTREVLGQYPIMDAGNGFFTCRALKGFMDGALGSFGAWFFEEYSDNPGVYGQNLMPIEDLQVLSTMAYEHELQMCIHAIGDRANREVLDIYESILGRGREAHERRWRIEHAQHLHPRDIPRFADMGIIAAIQSIHCVSDAPYVISRLGEQRSEEGAYAWRRLADFGTILVNGTDAPIELLDPFANLHAAVTRQRLDGQGAFYPGQVLSRQEALFSYTKAGAFAAFEEHRMGSIAPGFRADLIITDTNLLECTDDEIKKAGIKYTLIDGKIVYSK